jgi:organic radical activating enzyme
MGAEPISPTLISLTQKNAGDRQRVIIEWLLSNVCNYSCSYCPAYLHDGRVRWPRYDDIIRFCRRVVSHYSGKQATFLLSGGEITLYRELPRLAGELRGLGAAVALLTNGSRPVGWWLENAGLFDEVIVSYHHERADDEHLLEVVRLLAQASRVQVNVVIDPSAFDLTMRFSELVETRTNAVLNRKVMFRDSWKRVAEYSPAQRERLAAALGRESAQASRGEAGSVLKSDLLATYQDGETRTVTALQLISEDLNHWEGWDCAVGEETLFIRFDEVWRSVCRVGNRIGTIYDEDLALPRGNIKCTAASCNCIAGIKATKSIAAL